MKVMLTTVHQKQHTNNQYYNRQVTWLPSPSSEVQVLVRLPVSVAP